VVIARFMAALTENSCGVHGPLGPDRAVARVVELAVQRAGNAPIAIPSADPLVTRLGIGDALERAGAKLLLPTDPAWAVELPHAGVGVTGALVAVAETGSVALAAAPGAPRGTSLLPPVHVCVVDSGAIVETLERALERVAECALPSALTWVSGPSRTGDLEMRITLGVHGPKAVEVVVVAAT